VLGQPQKGRAEAELACESSIVIASEAVAITDLRIDASFAARSGKIALLVTFAGTHRPAILDGATSP
jgi:hypothetical protein